MRYLCMCLWSFWNCFATHFFYVRIWIMNFLSLSIGLLLKGLHHLLSKSIDWDYFQIKPMSWILLWDLIWMNGNIILVIFKLDRLFQILTNWLYFFHPNIFWISHGNSINDYNNYMCSSCQYYFLWFNSQASLIFSFLSRTRIKTIFFSFYRTGPLFFFKKIIILLFFIFLYISLFKFGHFTIGNRPLFQFKQAICLLFS